MKLFIALFVLLASSTSVSGGTVEKAFITKDGELEYLLIDYAFNRTEAGRRLSGMYGGLEVGCAAFMRNTERECARIQEYLLAEENPNYKNNIIKMVIFDDDRYSDERIIFDGVLVMDPESNFKRILDRQMSMAAEIEKMNLPLRWCRGLNLEECLRVQQSFLAGEHEKMRKLLQDARNARKRRRKQKKEEENTGTLWVPSSLEYLDRLRRERGRG